jgi:hypothetical protein
MVEKPLVGLVAAGSVEDMEEYRYYGLTWEEINEAISAQKVVIPSDRLDRAARSSSSTVPPRGPGIAGVYINNVQELTKNGHSAPPSSRVQLFPSEQPKSVEYATSRST